MAKQKVLFYDTETFGAQFIWDMPTREFVRLFQYAWGRDGDVHLTTDYDEMLSIVREADLIIAHNQFSFDTVALFGKDSTEPLEMALEKKILDTMVWASLVTPAPYSFTTRDGHTYFDAAKPEKARKYLSLDNLAHVFGVEGKIGDLKAMAKKHTLDPENPEHVAIALEEHDVDNVDDLPAWAWDGFGRIPLDDPEFLEYAEQDVKVLQQVAGNLLHLCDYRISDYTWREMLNAAIDAQNSKNGILVDVEAAQARVDELAAERDKIMAWLVEEFDFPTKGKQPWKSNDGKVAILKALESYDITPDNSEWARTAKGAPSFGGEVMLTVTEGTKAEPFGEALATLLGQRSLAQLALESVHADGRAHPDITTLQRSGRKSTTKPGLTVWSARGDKAIEKKYFVAAEGHSLVELDYSQADARIVAAYSGDSAFAERFAEGVDAHELTGRLVFGEEYDQNPYEYRQTAKALGHAYAYRAGPKTLSATAKQPLEVAERFVGAMNDAYPRVIRWQERVTQEGESGWVTNDWGRRMMVDVTFERGRRRTRAWTQAPALYGQSGTREIVVDALIRMARFDIRLIQWLRMQVHDALVFEIPNTELEWAVPKITELMETKWAPSDGSGMEIHFPVSAGKPSKNWYESSHD